MKMATILYHNDYAYYGETHLSVSNDQKVLDKTVKRQVGSKKVAVDDSNRRAGYVTTAPTDASNPSAGLSESSVIAIPGLFKPRTIRGISVNTLNEWEGYVVEVTRDHIVAHLRDVTAGAKEADEEAIIPLSEINPDDLSRAVPGAIFNWIIGYSRSTGSTQRRESLIYFRTYVSKTNKIANEFSEIFGGFAREAENVGTAGR